MADEIYTLGVWKVKRGQEDRFIEAWKGLGRFFYSLPNPPGLGTLVQSADDPTRLYSFGPWKSMEDVQAMRSHPRSAEEIGKLRELCEEGGPGVFRVVARMPESE
ncbi:MAG TPA: hypothetical protein VIW01_07290 [Dehalococcoidia bacterium]